VEPSKLSSDSSQKLTSGVLPNLSQLFYRCFSALQALSSRFGKTAVESALKRIDQTKNEMFFALAKKGASDLSLSFS